MRYISKIIFFSIFNLLFIESNASDDFISGSDLYGDSVPKPTVVSGIKYTTPALQGIRTNNLVLNEVSEIIKSQLQVSNLGRCIHDGNIYIMLRRFSDGGMEVSSVWKE